MRSAEHAGTSILVLGILVACAFLLAILSAVGSAYVAHAELQQAADVAATAIERLPGDSPRRRAVELARANGATHVAVTELDGGTRLRIRVRGRARVGFGDRRGGMVEATAWATVPRPAALVDGSADPPGVYDGPLELVDGVPVCPKVAAAYRAMEAAAARGGIVLTATSGFRGYAEQARIFAALGPGIAAPPGASRHHDATELDIAVGPTGSAVHRWLGAHGPAHGFLQRYSWEPWHWGHVHGC